MQGKSKHSNVWSSGDVLAERYLVEEPIAEGGMGAVFKARDLKLDKTVAVKTLLRADLTDEEFVRFQREAKVASHIDHRNVVKIYDFGIDKVNRPYLVMEYLSGETLKRWLSRNGIPGASIALDIVRQIASGMADVHKAGIVHRDLKSSNVMLSQNSDGKLVVRLLDFGAARVAKNDQILTQQGVIVGTPKYLSPEQALGGNVDERSDVYSLGCIAYELLCGRTPFEGDTPLETIEMHLNNQPSPLSEIGADVDPAVDALVLKMLAKDPDERIGSMVALIDEIDRLILSEPSTLPEAVTNEKRRVSTVTITAVFAVIFIVSGSALLWINQFNQSDGNEIAKTRGSGARAMKKDADSYAKMLSQMYADRDEGSFQNAPDPAFDPAVVNKTKLPIQSFLYLNPEDAATLEDCVRKQVTIPTIMVDKIQVTDHDIDSIVKLKPKWLLLSRTGIVDRHLEMLSKCQSIETLKFYKNPKITADGIKSLRVNRGLRIFSVRDCNITDDCMREIKEFKNLRSLDLEYNKKLTRKGLMMVAALPRIEVLSIFDTGIDLTPPQAEALKKKLHLKHLYVETTFSSPQAIAQVDEYRRSTIPGMGTGPLYLDLRQMYEEKFQTKGK